jgi:farnesyl-diphosphate farnesyltransferase
MATGMAEFVGKDLGQGTTAMSMNAIGIVILWRVLVGEGLSRLFAASGLDTLSVANDHYLSNQMGLFLQTTNIIRDYLEDYVVDGRAFWPQTILEKYAKTGELGCFINQEDAEVQAKSLECVNELVTDALELGPDCLAFMDQLHCQ